MRREWSSRLNNLVRPEGRMDWCLGMTLHLSLSHFSILGTVRMWSYMGTLLLRGGLKPTVCFTTYVDDAIVKFWSCVFLLSKIIELGE
jgi:hypothetical protein